VSAEPEAQRAQLQIKHDQVHAESPASTMSCWKNGYTFHETPYRRGVSIANVNALHKAIGRALIQRPRLTG
jgi:hypothetical protein